MANGSQHSHWYTFFGAEARLLWGNALLCILGLFFALFFHFWTGCFVELGKTLHANVTFQFIHELVRILEPFLQRWLTFLRHLEPISPTYIRTAFKLVAPKTIKIQKSCHLLHFWGLLLQKLLIKCWYNWHL